MRDKILDYNDFSYVLNKTALHYCCEKGYDSIIQLLIKNGSKIQIKDFEGKTAISYYSKNSFKNLQNLFDLTS